MRHFIDLEGRPFYIAKDAVKHIIECVDHVKVIDDEDHEWLMFTEVEEATL
jgi:hypothetical protein